MMSSTSGQSYSLFCTECGTRKSASSDPHLQCRLCREACTFSSRCQECENLSPKEFKAYEMALQKSARQAENKRKKRLMTAKASTLQEGAASPASSHASRELSGEREQLVLQESTNEFEEEAPSREASPERLHRSSRSPQSPRVSHASRRDSSSPPGRGRDRKKKRRKRSHSRSRGGSRSVQSDFSSLLGEIRSVVSSMLDERLGAQQSSSQAPLPVSEASPQAHSTPHQRKVVVLSPSRHGSGVQVQAAVRSREVPEFIDTSNPPFLRVLPEENEVDDDTQVFITEGSGDGQAIPDAQGRLDIVAEFAGVDLQEVQLETSTAKKARLESFATSSVSAPPRKVLPAHRLFTSAVQDLNDSVRNASPGHLLPQLVLSDKQRQALPMASEFPLTPPVLDSDLSQIASGTIPHKATDAQLVHMDKEARSILGLGNYVAHACEAMANFARDAGMEDGNPQLFHAFGAVAGNLAQMMLAAARISASLTSMRRDGILARAALTADLRASLRQEQASGSSLFAGGVSNVLRLRQERQQQQLTRMAVDRGKGATPKKQALKSQVFQPVTPSKGRKGGMNFQKRGRGPRSTPKSPNTPKKGKSGTGCAGKAGGATSKQ